MRRRFRNKQCSAIFKRKWTMTEKEYFEEHCKMQLIVHLDDGSVPWEETYECLTTTKYK